MTYWALIIQYEQIDIEVKAEPDGIYAYCQTMRGCTNHGRFTLRYVDGAWCSLLARELTGPPGLLALLNDAYRYLAGEWWLTVAGEGV